LILPALAGAGKTSEFFHPTIFGRSFRGPLPPSIQNLLHALLHSWRALRVVAVPPARSGFAILRKPPLFSPFEDYTQKVWQTEQMTGENALAYLQ
jgi:hypothetical protein